MRFGSIIDVMTTIFIHPIIFLARVQIMAACSKLSFCGRFGVGVCAVIGSCENFFDKNMKKTCIVDWHVLTLVHKQE